MTKTNRHISIASIGECMVELQESAGGVLHRSYGGDTLNTAIYMARLHHLFDVSVDYVTAIGCDRFSEGMVAFWEKEGVGSEMVLRIPGERPGLYFIETGDRGERSFTYWRGEAAAKKCFDYPESTKILQDLGRYDAIYLSGISIAILTAASRENLFARLKEIAGDGVRIYFDYNHRPHLWSSNAEARATYEKILPCCDTVLAGPDELEAIHHIPHETGHTYLAELGVRETVIRNGPELCTVQVGEDNFSIEAEHAENVIDTTAAGDSFSAGYLLARTFDCSVIQAARIAHRLAAYVIGHPGAIAPIAAMPTFTDLLEPR